MFQDTTTTTSAGSPNGEPSFAKSAEPPSSEPSFVGEPADAPPAFGHAPPAFGDAPAFGKSDAHESGSGVSSAAGVCLERRAMATPTLAEMPLASVKAVYRFWAPLYNYVFGMHVDDGRRKAMSFMPKPGRILEIGVGTGLSIPHYEPQQRVVGIDISKEMLEIAKKRYGHLPCLEQLVEMDCEDLKFPDQSFDSVAAMYVATVVPDPRKMMSEMSRVCKHGGTIIVLNHWATTALPATPATPNHLDKAAAGNQAAGSQAAAGDPNATSNVLAGAVASLRKFLTTASEYVMRATGSAISACESALSPMSAYLGFRPNMTLDQFLALTDRQLLEVIPVNYFGYWKLCIFKNVPAPDDNVSFKDPGTPSTVVSPTPSL